MKRAALASLLIFSACVVFIPNRAVAQADDFNDGNDTGWVRYDPLGTVGLGPMATYSFPNGGYRIQPRRHPAIPASAGPARAGAYFTNEYSDFYMTADIVNWDESMDQAIGFLARMSQLGLGTTDGYALTYQVPDHDIDITRFTDEGAVELTSIPLTPTDRITMVPGRSYRYVWIGKGSKFTVRVYELPNVTTPILECTGIDDRYPTGVCGFLVYDNSGSANAGVADATFDNYLAQEVEPPRLTITSGSFGDIFVSWAADTPDTFALQTTPNLSTTPVVWTTVTEGIVLSEDGTRKTYNDTSFFGGNKFYRMAKP